ncbi:MAG: DUF481 domain-containing protein [Flavobacteriaceae bacterium]|nr:DUF481 domain-containing protein [Flavobacteriaceae bacterium]
MNRRRSIAIIFFLLSLQEVKSQEQSNDSIQFSIIDIGLRGMWQTGTTNQFEISPNYNVQLYRKNYFFESVGQYQFLKVNNFAIINDLWSSLLFQYKQEKKFYPFVTASGGTAKSFLLNHFIFTGAGIGSNLYKKSASEYIQIHAFVGYLDFEIATDLHQALSVGSILRANINLAKKVQLNCEFRSYHSAKESSYWGLQNTIRLNLQVTKNLGVNLNHRLFYNQQVGGGIEQLNTTLLFGLNYQFRKDN